MKKAVSLTLTPENAMEFGTLGLFLFAKFKNSSLFESQQCSQVQRVFATYNASGLALTKVVGVYYLNILIKRAYGSCQE